MYGTYEKHVIDGLAANNYGGANLITANAAAANIFETRAFVEPITVQRFGFRVTTAFVHNVDDGQNLKIKLYRCPTANNANAVEIDELEVPLGNIAVGSVVYADVDNAYVAANATVPAHNAADLNAGDSVQMRVSANMTGTNKTGIFDPFIVYNFRPEADGNQALVVDLTD